jgi:two-component system chemotaxis response regulator CheY
MARKILIADDAAAMHMMIENALRKNGYHDAEFYKAHDGIKAVALLDEIIPDLAIVDMTLPGVSGTDVLKAIKAKYPAVPVIMASSMGQQSQVIDCIRAGAKEFVVKPFQPERLVEVVKKVTG